MSSTIFPGVECSSVELLIQFVPTCTTISVAVAVAACIFNVAGSAPLVLLMLTLLLASLLRPNVLSTLVIESPSTTRSPAAGGPPGCCLSVGSGCAVAGSSGGLWLGGGWAAGWCAMSALYWLSIWAMASVTRFSLCCISSRMRCSLAAVSTVKNVRSFSRSASTIFRLVADIVLVIELSGVYI